MSRPPRDCGTTACQEQPSRYLIITLSRSSYHLFTLFHFPYYSLTGAAPASGGYAGRTQPCVNRHRPASRLYASALSPPHLTNTSSLATMPEDVTLHSLIQRPSGFPGYPPGRWCGACGKSTSKRTIIDCSTGDCPSTSLTTCLGDNTFDCSGNHHPVVNQVATT